MKNLIFILLILVLLFPPSAIAEMQDVSKFDGNDWRGWDILLKYSFIGGFIAGTAYVIENNMQSQDKNFDSDKASKVYFQHYFVPDDKKPKNTFSRNEVSLLLGKRKEYFNVSLISYIIFEISNDQIVDGLNLLYNDFKNRQIKLKDAIYIVKKQIKGASPEEMEAIFQYLRADKEFSKLFYTDKEGKKNWATFP